MPPWAWIVMWVVVIATLAFFAIREHRSGRRVAPDAVRRRRDDTARMRATSEFQGMAKKDPRQR